MGRNHGFGEEDDLGIFVDRESASAKDPDLAEDLEIEGYVAPVAVASLDSDGLAVLEVEETGLLDAPSAVTPRNFVCIAGPCRHYTENAVLRMQGPSDDADEGIEMERWCGRLRTWAEQTDLTELEVCGCNAYEPDQSGDLDETRVTLAQSSMEIASVRKRGIEVGARYGICANGPCEDFVEIVGRKPHDRGGPTKSWRFCTRLAGLGRLYSLLEEPVVACSAWKPRSRSEKIAVMASRNLERLAKYRQGFAARRESQDDDGERDDRTAGPAAGRDGTPGAACTE
jgi:hypothetical protein